MGITAATLEKTLKVYSVQAKAQKDHMDDFTESEDVLLNKCRPEFWDLPTANGEHCTGDGQKLALAIGQAPSELRR